MMIQLALVQSCIENNEFIHFMSCKVSEVYVIKKQKYDKIHKNITSLRL